ncbi:MAG: hypothetical protein WCP19_07290 [Chloroflexota bacterium]
MIFQGRKISLFVSIIIAVCFSFYSLPVEALRSPNSVPYFSDFQSSLINGEKGVLRGLFVDDLFAFRIVQQPADNPLFVSSIHDVVTEFQAVENYGNIGLLAHNYLAGRAFTLLKPGRTIRVIYGDGQAEVFVVKKVLSYRAIQPASPYSDFVNLATGDVLTFDKVFEAAYQGKHHLTLQTCIFNNGEPSWGRLFVIAEPINYSFLLNEK